MPAFVYRGNTSIWNTTHELYRVEVFTDEDCLNTVFIGAITGAPAYVPRPTGPLGLPTDVPGRDRCPDDLPQERQRAHVHHGGRGRGEDQRAGQVHRAADREPHQPPGGADRKRREGRPLGQQLVRRPLLLDGDARRTSSRRTSSRRRSRSRRFGGDTTINVVDSTGIVAGDAVRIGSPGELGVVKSVAGNHDHARPSAIGNSHLPGDARRSARRRRQTTRSAELTQDACASGRRLTFAKESEPVVTGSAAPYASGLSPEGKLVAAAKREAAVLRPAADRVAAGRRRRPVRGAVEPEALPMASLRLEIDLGHLADPPARPGHVVLPRPRPRLPDDRLKAADVVVDPVRVVVTKPRFRVVR